MLHRLAVDLVLCIEPLPPPISNFLDLRFPEVLFCVLEQQTNRNERQQDHNKNSLVLEFLVVLGLHCEVKILCLACQLRVAVWSEAKVCDAFFGFAELKTSLWSSFELTFLRRCFIDNCL